MNERTLSVRSGFRGKLLNVDVIDVELTSGKRAVREIVRHPGAAVVLAQRPDGRFVLVRQFRKAAERLLLETVAGTLDPGEDPATCARRELQEETGYRARKLVPLGTAFPAPGYTEELLHFFFARTTDDEPGNAAPDEDEIIDTEVLTAREVETRIANGEIIDAKTLVAWLLYRQKGVSA